MTRWQRFTALVFVRVIMPIRNFLRRDPVINRFKSQSRRTEIVLTDFSTEPEPAIKRTCHICGREVWIPLDWLPSAVYGPWPEHKACSMKSGIAI